MPLNAQQANAVTSAVWLVGVGVLIVTGAWWPGVMFLIGTTAIAQGFVEGRGRASWHAGLWSIGIGAWALSSYNILVLFIAIALSGLAEAFLAPPKGMGKPEPDHELIDDRI